MRGDGSTNWMRWLAIGGAVTLALGGGIVWAVRQESPAVDRFHVGGAVRRLSGDHLKLKDGRVVEFAGLRLPYDDEPAAEDARRTLMKWIEDEGVRLQFDEQKEDSKGRLLAYVFANDTSINERLLRAGFAFAKLRRGQKRHAEEFLNAQNEARRERRGLWRTLTPIAEGRYMLDEAGATFHRPDCEKVKESPTQMRVITGSAPAFDAGCAPCGKCRP